MLGAPVAIFLGYYFFSVRAWINTQPGTALVEDFYAGLVLATLLLFLIQFLPIPRTHRHALSLLWLIRCAVALGFSYYFDSYHIFDAMFYFRSGAIDAEYLSYYEFGDGNVLMMILSSIVSEVVISYKANTVFFAFIGLLAVYIYYLAMRIFLGREMLSVLYIIGILPSVLFWTSMLSKEPWTLLSYAVYVYGVIGLYTLRKSRFIMFILLGIIMAMMMRIWLGMIMFAPLIGAYVFSARTPMVLKLGFIVIGVPVFLFTLQQFASTFAIDSTQDLLTTSNDLSQNWARGTTAQTIEGGFDSIGSMILFMPLGSFTALFRPLPGEVLNPLGMIAGIENLAILVMIVMGLRKHGFAWTKQPLLVWAAMLLLCWAAIYGFVSYQNLGTAFRFRTQVAVVLFLFAAYLLWAEAPYERRVQGRRPQAVISPGRLKPSDFPAE